MRGSIRDSGIGSREMGKGYLGTWSDKWATYRCLIKLTKA